MPFFSSDNRVLAKVVSVEGAHCAIFSSSFIHKDTNLKNSMIALLCTLLPCDITFSVLKLYWEGSGDKNIEENILKTLTCIT